MHRLTGQHLSPHRSIAALSHMVDSRRVITIKRKVLLPAAVRSWLNKLRNFSYIVLEILVMVVTLMVQLVTGVGIGWCKVTSAAAVNLRLSKQCHFLLNMQLKQPH
jgi:hypothetical protein